jgi:hypothetical protein
MARDGTRSPVRAPIEYLCPTRQSRLGRRIRDSAPGRRDCPGALRWPVRGGAASPSPRSQLGYHRPVRVSPVHASEGRPEPCQHRRAPYEWVDRPRTGGFGTMADDDEIALDDLLKGFDNHVRDEFTSIPGWTMLVTPLT